MDEFLKQYFSDLKELKKEKLPGDGGHRDYTRIRIGRKSFILMSCGKKDISLQHFVDVQKRLSPFVSVPKLFHKDIAKGLLLLEDLGDQSLEKVFYGKGIQSSIPLYHKALKQLISIQEKIQLLQTDPVFHKDFFLKENEMAIYHLQTYVNVSKGKTLFDKNSSLNFKKDIEKLSLNFELEDYVYCHRDYHSRNLMIKEGQTVLIDFQDAGSGPWYYDLTSLFYDSYVSLSPLRIKDLSYFYFDHLPKHLKKKAQTVSHIELMAKLQFLQRGFKACGCFAAFKNRDKKSTHLKYIQPTFQILEQKAFELSYKGIYEYIRDLKEAIEELSVEKS